MTIIGSRGKTGEPAVSVRLAGKGNQTTFGFNAPLVRLLGLAAFKRVSLDYDAEARVLTFTPTDAEQLGGGGTYVLGLDGGSRAGRGPSERRAAHVRRNATGFARPGTYLVKALEGARFAIFIGGPGRPSEAPRTAPAEVPATRKPKTKKHAG